MYLNYCLNGVKQTGKCHTYDYVDLLEEYGKVSSHMNICKVIIDITDADILEKLNELSELYDDFNNFKKGLEASTSDKCQKAKK
ncbi:PIR Superfamily Protein [Plasmodium ovale wallikeri]|uniref:PIR Superfamily Protein n=1 Tax=Plasmodium ovale wallikeri TaxID=864142 RepID=A0A1A8YLK2_PLAOA|nr:PIR Superfamily Protein [Plasmodium ovale wallikeri]SBT55311.1 PIR Superfamily Protein [Plasmodium ovale wallikeri]